MTSQLSARLAALAGAMLLAGCGGSDTPTAAPAPAPAPAPVAE